MGGKHRAVGRDQLLGVLQGRRVMDPWSFGSMLGHAQAGQPQQAIPELNEAITLDPKYTDARVQLGLVLSQSNDQAAATNVFRELVRRDRMHTHVSEANRIPAPAARGYWRSSSSEL